MGTTLTKTELLECLLHSIEHCHQFGNSIHKNKKWLNEYHQIGIKYCFYLLDTYLSLNN